MTGSLLLRGMLAGLLAAFLAFGFARLYAEPQIERAIAFEESREHAHGDVSDGTSVEAHDHAGDEGGGVSRQTQAGIGLLIGLSTIGAAAGGLFSIVFALSRGRVGPLDPKSLSVCLALAAYVVVVVVPGLKYPANPPAAGAPETIALRTILFFSMVAISIVAALFALQTTRLLSTAIGTWNGSLIGLATFCAIIAAAYAALPATDELPEGFSSDVLWRFRMGSFGTQAVLWAALGVLFGFAAEKVLGARRERDAALAR